MTTEREFHRTHTGHHINPIEDDIAPARLTKSSRLEAPAHPEPSGLLLRKASRDDNGVADGAAELVSAASGGSGSALPAPLMRKFESSLGADLSSVRIHTGGDSAAAAHAVGARAYTIGQDIHFGAGQYDPSSVGGEHLLAHEVAHTVQQQGGAPTRQNKLEVSVPGDHLEAEADRAATAMVSGQCFSVTSGSGFQRKVFRGKNSAAAQADSKIWIDVPLTKVRTSKLKYLTIDIQMKAKIGLQFSNIDQHGIAASAPVTTGSTFSSKGAGPKTEVELAKQQVVHSLLGLKFPNTVKETLSFELSTGQFKAAIGTNGRIAWDEFPGLQGALDTNFIFAAVKWADLLKDPDSIKVAAVDAAVGVSGETQWRGAKVTVVAQVVGTGSPNWVQIAAEAAKQAARSGAQAAGTSTTTASGATAAAEGALVVETGAVASAAAAIILPLAAGAAMVAGANQTEKNVVASRAAIAAGLKMRSEIDQYVSGYVDALAGRSATGAGAIAANAKVLGVMAEAGKTREQAGRDVLEHNGGREKLKAELTAQLRGQLYDDAVTWFEQKFADQFGFVEKCGETWGMRGVFRKDLYRMLYGGDTSTAPSSPDSRADDTSEVASIADTDSAEPNWAAPAPMLDDSEDTSDQEMAALDSQASDDSSTNYDS